MKSLAQGLGFLLNPRRQRKPAPVLGGRELEVLKILWQNDDVSAQEVQQQIGDEAISLSTLQSTLERLYRKQLVSRIKTGRYYRYNAAVSRSVIISQLLGDIAERISDGEMAPMISGFMSFIDQEAPETLPTQVREAIEQLSTDDND